MQDISRKQVAAQLLPTVKHACNMPEIYLDTSLNYHTCDAD
jgi:hypothetical protein